MTLSQASNYLAVHLHRELSKEKKNVFFSPFSISVAMGMLLCGAEGETASELREALGHKHAGIKLNEVASVFEKEMSLLLQHNDSYTLSFANSMLFQIGFQVKDEYKEVMSKSFKSLISEVDFYKDNEKVLNEINKWVKETTKEKIPKFLESLDPSTILVLLNAVYFKGTWANQFDKEDTKSEKFYNNGSTFKTKNVDMMHMKESFPFYEEKTYQALQLPYVGEEVAMMILLPKKRNGLDEVEANLSPSFVQDIKKKLIEMKVKIAIPKFRLEYGKGLIPAFKKLGVKRVFSDAELTNLCNESGLFVNVILHKAVLEVNEEGSEAAAATMVSVARCLPPPCPEFIADHPFLLVIYNTKNDLILFIGRVNEL